MDLPLGVTLWNKRPDIAYLESLVCAITWGFWLMYTISYQDLDTQHAQSGRSAREPFWLKVIAFSSVATVTAAFAWRMTSTGDTSYTSIEVIPGAAWWASLTAQAFSQCAAAGCLAWLRGRYRPSGADSHPLAVRVSGTLLAFWGAIQLAATATTATLCGTITSAVASWWIPLLLASSAFGEFLIAVTCLLLLHRAASAESRTASLKFCLGITGGCLLSIAFSIAMIICRYLSASIAWEVLSTVAPFYRVVFLMEHIRHQSSVLVPMHDGPTESTSTEIEPDIASHTVSRRLASRSALIACGSIQSLSDTWQDGMVVWEARTDSIVPEVTSTPPPSPSAWSDTTFGKIPSRGIAHAGTGSSDRETASTTSPSRPPSPATSMVWSLDAVNIS